MQQRESINEEIICFVSEPPQNSALKKLIQAGTWDPSLSACTWTNASSINKMQRNYKGLKINCTHACTVGANYEQDTKRQKPQLPLLRSQKQKRGYCTWSMHTAPPREWASHPWTNPTLTCRRGTSSLAPSPGWEQAREPATWFRSLLLQQKSQ